MSKQGDTVSVNCEQETKLRVPIHNLGSIVCFGNVGCSPFLMGLCGENNVSLSFLTENGRFLARVHGPVSGNVLLRREQYRQADTETTCATVARAIITAKIANCRIVLLRAMRDRPEDDNADALKIATRKLAGLLYQLKGDLGLADVRGLEGEAARYYFSVLDNLVRSNRSAFFLRQRTRRPPLDNMNSLLSFIYTLLLHDITAALEAVGLDPAVGFLHKDRPGRASLALDIMEEFRAYLADRLALSLINRQQLQPAGFRKTESGAVTMNDETRKTVLVAWQKRKQDEITHPFLNEKVPVGLLAHIQAMLLARYLRGDLEGYPPFLWK